MYTQTFCEPPLLKFGSFILAFMNIFAKHPDFQKQWVGHSKCRWGKKTGWDPCIFTVCTRKELKDTYWIGIARQSEDCSYQGYWPCWTSEVLASLGELLAARFWWFTLAFQRTQGPQHSLNMPLDLQENELLPLCGSTGFKWISILLVITVDCFCGTV